MRKFAPSIQFVLLFSTFKVPPGSSSEWLDGLARLGIGYSSIYTVALLYITSLALVPQPNTEKTGIWFWRDVSRYSQNHHSLRSKVVPGPPAFSFGKLRGCYRVKFNLCKLLTFVLDIRNTMWLQLSKRMAKELPKTLRPTRIATNCLLALNI